MTSDQWSDLIQPTRGSITRRLIDYAGPIELYAAIDHIRRPHLVLTTTTAGSPKRESWQGSNISVAWRPSINGSGISVEVILLNNDMMDLFVVLCNNLSDLVRNLPASVNLFDAVLFRVERWKRLLNGLQPRLLSPSARRGLVGELLLLIDVLIPAVGADVIVGWLGPKGWPQDFVLPQGRIECKSSLDFPFDEIRIPSLEQLDDKPLPITLALNHLAESSRESEGQTLNQLVTRAENLAITTDQRAHLNEVLHAADYEFNGSYDTLWYSCALTRYYRVASDFPRLNSSNVDSRIQRVSYSIPLAGLDGFIVPTFDSSWGCGE